MVIWLIGLSGAGKTAIGTALFEQIKMSHTATVMIDGDAIRKIFSLDKKVSDYSVESRRLNAERIFEICNWLDQSRINVICSILSIFPDLQIKARNEFSNYYQIFIDVPLEELIRRNAKGVYRTPNGDMAKNIVGLDINFPLPSNSDLRIENNHLNSTHYLAKKILGKINECSAGDFY